MCKGQKGGASECSAKPGSPDVFVVEPEAPSFCYLEPLIAVEQGAPRMFPTEPGALFYSGLKP